MNNDKINGGVATDRLDAIVRRAERCNECGHIVEGRLFTKEKQFQVSFNRRCGCDGAIERMMKKMGVSWDKPNASAHPRRDETLNQNETETA